MSNKKTGIIAGGHAIFLGNLREEEREAVAALKRKLAAESDPREIEKIRARIKEVKKDFKKKRKEAELNLY